MSTTTTTQAPWHAGQLPSVTGQYAICPATQSDIMRVINWYQTCPVSGSSIGSVQIIHNPQMARMFQGHVDLLEQRHGKTAFAPKWKTESKSHGEKAEREKVMTLFTKAAFPHTYAHAPHVSLLPLWHGTAPDVLESIFTTGYANLAATDSGFFGNGLYSTTDAAYAPAVSTAEAPSSSIGLPLTLSFLSFMAICKSSKEKGTTKTTTVTLLLFFLKTLPTPMKTSITPVKQAKSIPTPNWLSSILPKFFLVTLSSFKKLFLLLHPPDLMLASSLPFSVVFYACQCLKSKLILNKF